MRIKTKKIAISVISIALLTGCGSTEDDTTPSDEDSSVLVGRFIDSPVYGLKYKTKTQNSYTNENGEFKYKAGEEIEFFIDNLSLGVVSASSLVTPYTLADDTDYSNPTIKTAAIAILLQNLDYNKSNKDFIDLSKFINLSEFNLAEDINLSTNSDGIVEHLTSLLKTGKFVGYIDSNSTIIDYDSAIEHLHENTLNTNPKSLLKQTGQISSHVNGDDGDYRRGTNWSYQRTSKETVIDYVTNLEWQDDSDVKQNSVQTLNESNDYCANLTLGGYSDWRVPNIVELESIVNYNNSTNYISSIFENINNSVYISKETNKYEENQTYGIDFNSGLNNFVSYILTNEDNETEEENSENSVVSLEDTYIRCVRGKELLNVYTENSFVEVDEDGNMIKDTSTNLIWQNKYYDDEGNEIETVPQYSLENAIKYCENLELGGYSNWILPNIVELISLRDTNRITEDDRNTMKEGFAISVDEDYLSSTVDVTNSSKYWRVNFYDGLLTKTEKTELGYVRCVRSDDFSADWLNSKNFYDVSKNDDNETIWDLVSYEFNSTTQFNSYDYDTEENITGSYKITDNGFLYINRNNNISYTKITAITDDYMKMCWIDPSEDNSFNFEECTDEEVYWYFNKQNAITVQALKSISADTGFYSDWLGNRVVYHVTSDTDDINVINFDINGSYTKYIYGTIDNTTTGEYNITSDSYISLTTEDNETSYIKLIDSNDTSGYLNICWENNTTDIDECSDNDEFEYLYIDYTQASQN
jgi:hypothetical protein